MQEWIIAMLVVSILLILRDMAKTVFSGKTKEKEEMLPLCESHPQKEKVERYAASFRKLADTFYGMPYRKEFLSGGQLNRIISDTSAAVCSRCYQREICWGERAGETMRGSENMIRTMEEGNEESIQRTRSEWMGACGRSAQYFQVLNEGFREERQNLVWDNRMIESRLAVAQQLTEISRIMEHMAEELYDIMPADPQFQEDLKKALRKKHVLVKNVWVMDKIEGRRQIFLNLRARSGQCVSMTEIAQILSRICGSSMTPDAGSRSIVNGDFRMVHFVEDVSYQMLYGVARLTREAEKVSGDNYICRQEEDGRFFLCLSDGMGSGIEASRIMEHMAEELYDIMPADPQFQEDLKKALRKKHVLVKNVWVMDKIEGRRQIFLNLRARSGQCVSMTEIAQILSRICGSSMTPDAGSRSIVNGDFRMVHFVEDVSYQMLYGVARLTREAEKVSGDNYICRQEEDGRFFLCLSDGMGSGIEAFKESEIVVELLEQFLESGFSQETAARMVNSALLLKGREGMFSTVDICAVDLYTGICDFLKAGASSTFIKRDHWVESIASENLAAGLVQQLDFDTASRKLYHGDYLIMMTDGVLDALPTEREEETMKEIIMDVREKEPREMGRGILERVLGYSDYHARDDMTVVVAGLWKK